MTRDHASPLGPRAGRRLGRALAGGLCLVLWTAGWLRAADALTPAAYRAELERLIQASAGLESRVDEIPALVRTLPPSWQVDDGGRRFAVSTAALRGTLDVLRRQPSPDGAAAFRRQVQRLRAELDAYVAPPRDPAGPRARVAAILARREFRDVHGPTWYDRLKERVLTWLVAFMTRLMGSSAIPTVSQIVIYALAGMAVLALAFLAYRSLRRHAHLETMVPEPVPVSARAWHVWLEEAREAARSGRWRDGVHLAYWAAISLLESNRTWPPDRARTPREYLRLMPAASEHRPSLESLTRTFEIVWYGGRSANADTFADALADLEKLGCR